MTTALDEIIDDLEAEQSALGRVLDALAAADWGAQTHAPGWSVRDHVSHLAFFDEAAALAITNHDAFAARADAALQGGSDLEDRYLARGRSLAASGVLDWWRTASR